MNAGRRKEVIMYSYRASSTSRLTPQQTAKLQRLTVSASAPLVSLVYAHSHRGQMWWSGTEYQIGSLG
ncbi:unnamed protein product [Jaminaea pallidilutea]